MVASVNTFKFAVKASKLNFTEEKSNYKTNPIESDVLSKERRKSLLRGRKLTFSLDRFLASYAPNLLFGMYLTDDSVKNMLRANPKVTEILEANGLPAKATIENIKNIVNGHLSQTQEFASGIAKQLGLSKEEIKTIETGALFHDFGKILIPAEVLDKESCLDEEERSIINLHSELGYELLKTSNLDDDVLDIIRYHHSPDKYKDIAIQVIAAADIYSALREERAYKPAYKHTQAMYIMQEHVRSGRLKKTVVDALESYMLEGAAK